MNPMHSILSMILVAFTHASSKAIEQNRISPVEIIRSLWSFSAPGFGQIKAKSKRDLGQGQSLTYIAVSYFIIWS